MSRHAPVDLEQIAKDTAAKMTAIAQQAYAPVVVKECPYCDGQRFTEDGSRCFYCGGKGRIATEGAEP